MCASRHEREIYEVNVRSGAYGERRWTIISVSAFALILLAETGLFLRNLLSGYLFILAVFAATALLLTIPILVRRIRRE